MAYQLLYGLRYRIAQSSGRANAQQKLENREVSSLALGL